MSDKFGKIFRRVFGKPAAAEDLTHHSISEVNFLVTGFPKCGTTSFHTMLWEHTPCRLPYGKELHGWNTFFEGPRTLEIELFPYDELARALPTSFEAYRTAFRPTEGPVVEITPSYIFRIERVHERILKVQDRLPTQIILVRDPIDAATSHFRMMWRNGVHAFGAEAIKRLDPALWESGSYRMCSLSCFRYDRLIPKAIELFDRTIVVDFADLVQNPQTVSEILAGAGIPFADDLRFPHSNSRETLEPPDLPADIEIEAQKFREVASEILAEAHAYYENELRSR